MMQQLVVGYSGVDAQLRVREVCKKWGGEKVVELEGSKYGRNRDWGDATDGFNDVILVLSV